MTVFIILAALLAAAAILLIAWPLLRPGADAAGKPVLASRHAAMALVVAVPVLAFLLYFHLTNWSWSAAGQLQDARHQSGESASLQQMADKLEQRLRREQGDADGWKLLGRTYVVMGDFPKALDAYEHAYTLTSGKDVEAMLGYAEARVLVNETDFEGEAGQIFETALKMAPKDPKALWYAGLTAYRRQDLPTARARWAALRELGAPPDILQVLDARLAEIDAQIGAAAATPAVAAAPPPGPAAAAGEGIALHVDVAPALAARVPPGATLFVLARSGEGGPPLAALRRSSSELPLDVSLTDANAMIPGTSLRQVDSLALVARVSLTGRPVASPGDLFGEVRYDPAAKGRIRLTIDKIVE